MLQIQYLPLSNFPEAGKRMQDCFRICSRFNAAKQAFVIPCAYRYKIGTSGR